MNELLFVGMDIMDEVKTLMSFTTALCTHDMSENECAAYECGVKNVLEALRATLDSTDGAFAINIPGIEIQEEFDIVDLEHYLVEISQ